MDLKTIICPNCGANTTNPKNCEYCGSLLVRFADKGIDLSQTSYLNNDEVIPGLIPELKKNLRLQEEKPDLAVVTDILIEKKGIGYESLSIHKTGLVNWMDHQPIKLGEGNNGLIIVSQFATYMDNSSPEFNRDMEAQLRRFQNLDSYCLFTQHISTVIDSNGHQLYYREYAIDFGQDVEGAARLVSEIMIKVNGCSNDTDIDIFTNAGVEVGYARQSWKVAHGYASATSYEEEEEDETDWGKVLRWTLYILGILIYMMIRF